MNAGLYTKLANGEELENELPAADIDAARYTLKQNWLLSTITEELFQKLSSDVDALEKQARELACTFHQHQNYHNIVTLLVRASEIRKVIEHASSRT